MSCRVYWGSHGCELERGHEGDCVCCCDCTDHPDPDSGCVGAPPYYGPRTRFSGEDAAARGLNTAYIPELCDHYGLYRQEEPDVDPCLGVLPNVWSACCGHGGTRDPYVQHRGSGEQHGGAALAWFELVGVGPDAPRTAPPLTAQRPRNGDRTVSRNRKREQAWRGHSDPTPGAACKFDGIDYENPVDDEDYVKPRNTDARRVYFAYSPRIHEVKIGWSANVTKRVAAQRLELLGTVPGGREIETMFHRRFGSFSTGREWFSPQILPEIQAILESEI